ncbi:MAG: LysR family transcriptional regulator [Bacteriovoracaceae bacterium]
MKIFVRVAELQSFTKTAEMMNLPKATVSTSIRDLEFHLSARLLNRTTRQVTLTPEGRQYLLRCKEILIDLEETDSMFQDQRETIKGIIRVDMATSFATEHFLPMLSRFTEKYPELEIELSCTDRTVDLVRDGIDCVIRSGAISQPGTIEKLLGQATMINCASPGYIQKYGKPKKLTDLTKHRLILYTQVLGARSWGFEYNDGKKYSEIKMPATITVNNTDAYLSACLAGFGIIQSPLHGVASYLKSGELIEVLPKFRAEPLAIKLAYVQRRLTATRVRIFMNWLENELKKIIH